MPIWLRNYTFKSIQDHFDKVKEAQDKAGKSETLANKSVQRPNISPNYTTKASRN